MDHEGRVVEFNPAAEKIFGYRREDIIGLPMDDLIIPPEQRERHRAGIRRFLNGGNAVILGKRLELTAMRSDGTEFPAELAVTQVPGPGPAMFLGFVRDITERIRFMEEQNRTADELRQVAAELSEADRRKNEFLATLADELRNPLVPLRNALHIIHLTATENEMLTSATAMMERQVSHMVHLVDDLLDVSRISRGKIELKKSRTELSTIVNHSVEAAQPFTHILDHQVNVSIPDRPLYLNVDPTRITQVIANLLTNAAKFTDRGGQIDLNVTVEGDEAVIRVKDNGIGIDPQSLPFVFDLFMQADTSLGRTQGGLGIGLTLTKSLVEMHDGRVAVRSDGIGHGSEFEVRLPLVEETDEAGNMLSTEGKVQAPPRRILVVDDNHDSAESLTLLLNLSGHTTHTAYDGLEAVEAASTFLPEVVLLDIGLPKLNGYEAARAIRREPWGQNMVLVALTGWGQDEDRKELA